PLCPGGRHRGRPGDTGRSRGRFRTGGRVGRRLGAADRGPGRRGPGPRPPRGPKAGTGVNLYTSAAPILVAIPVVIVVLRLYPLVLRGLLRVFARTSRAPAFLGPARASRAAVNPAP